MIFRLLVRYIVIEGRYPMYKKKLSTLIVEGKSTSILKETEVLFKWVKSKLK